jgi:hypothetical protein
MNQEPTEPENRLQITLNESLAATIERYLPSLMNRFEMNRDEALAQVLATGIIVLQESENETLKREPQVRDAIRKLKSGKHVSNDELEIVLIAAKNGHLDAQIILSDFERFDRAIDKEG